MCPVIKWYRVQRVVRENLAELNLTGNVGCSLPSGGLVSAVLYASKVRRASCQCSVHLAIALSCVLLF